MKDDWYWCIMAASLVFAILSVSIRVSQVTDAIKANSQCTQQEERK